MNLKMISLNVRGISSLEKQKALFQWPKKENADIFLQETQYSEVQHVWKLHAREEMFFEHGATNSQGVLVLTNWCFGLLLTGA